MNRVGERKIHNLGKGLLMAGEVILNSTSTSYLRRGAFGEVLGGAFKKRK